MHTFKLLIDSWRLDHTKNPSLQSRTTMDTISQNGGFPERLITSSQGRVSSTPSLSNSPTGHSHPSSLSKGGMFLPPSRIGVAAKAKQLKPFATEDIRILLLENINQTGRDILARQGYQVEFLKTSLPEDELIQKIRLSSFLPSDTNKEGHLMGH